MQIRRVQISDGMGGTIPDPRLIKQSDGGIPDPTAFSGSNTRMSGLTPNQVMVKVRDSRGWVFEERVSETLSPR